MHTQVVLLLLLCLGFIHVVHSQQCNDTYPYQFTQTNNLKMNSTYKLRLGFVGNYLTPEVFHVFAMTHAINNDPTILPDVEIQLYYASALTQENLVLAGMYLIRSLNIVGLISGATSIEARVSQLTAKIFNVPQIAGNAVSYQLTNKDEYPYFSRTVPADAFQIEGIVGLFKEMGWKRAIIIYTTDDYGTGYNRLVLAAQAAGISFISFGVPTTVVNATLAAPYAADVIAAAKEHDYRIFVFYTQYNPGIQMRAALMNASFVGQKYAYVLTVTMMRGPFYYGNIASSYPTEPSGPWYERLKSIYNTTKGSLPWTTTTMASAWYSTDCLLTFAHAFDRLMKSGVPFAQIRKDKLQAAVINTTFQGVTGFVTYDTNGDRLGQYDLYSMGPNFTTKVAYYNAYSKNYTRFGEYIFGDASTKKPRDGPYICSPACAFGTCVEDVGCVCDAGYYGDACNVEHKKSDSTPFVAIVVPCVGAVGIGLIIGIFVYRKKRSQLVKQVAEKQRSNISRTDIVMGQRIGRGASGEVFKATFRGTEVAVKKIITANVDTKVIEEFELEVAMMCGLRHPNIILFMGSSFEAANKEMLLVMEFMTRGSLHDVLHNPTIELNYDMKLHLACQAAQGMNFLHMSTPPIIHSDLKSHNILLDDKWNARISDFGITKFKGQSASNGKSTPTGTSGIGTIFWTSPETLAGTDHSEKSDCYSFGIVLWEIFHRQDPYYGRDPMSVASEVISRDLRPTMSPEVPIEMKDLIKQCWHKDPQKRPTFQEIMNVLRGLSLKNPNYMSGLSNDRMDAPQGLVYLVHTAVVGSFATWSAEPEEMCEAVRLEKQLIRNNLQMYKGYEASSDLHSFLLAFTTAEDAINFCVATQISLLHVDWPRAILNVPQCSTVKAPTGEVIWKGLRLRMAVLSGVPNCEVESSTGRVVYIGAMVDKVKKMLKGIKSGSVIITDKILQETTKSGAHFTQDISTKKVGDMNVTARGSNTSPIHEVVIKGLEGRDAATLETSNSNLPHVLMDIDEISTDDSPNKSNADGHIEATATWVTHYEELDVKENLGKGATGDYHRGFWKGKEVAIKTLINQKMKENDMLKLTGDAAYMSTFNHPNILPLYAVCLDPNRVSLISEYMARGSLRAILSDSSISLTLAKKLKIASEIAQGMKFLDSLPDQNMRKHDNLKSGNILIGKDWEVKLADYGQSNIKDLARTMTSVGSVAWTAPEILNGEENCGPLISIYSFGIICWELLTRQVPYAAEHPIRVVAKIVCGYRPTIPPDCPSTFRRTIEQCWSGTPHERPTWETIIGNISTAMHEV